MVGGGCCLDRYSINPWPPLFLFFVVVFCVCCRFLVGVDDMTDVLRLEGNMFTGSIPTSLCSLLGTGVNQLQIMTADCIKEVNCTCCTKCY